MMTSRLSGSEQPLRDRATAALARSEKTRAELVALLCRHAPRAQAQAVVEDLAAQGLQSDARCAAVRAQQAVRRGQAAAATLQALLEAGVDPPVAHAAVEQAYAGQDEEALLRGQVARLLPDGAPPQTARKVARRLLRAGFDPDRVARACGLDGD